MTICETQNEFDSEMDEIVCDLHIPGLKIIQSRKRFMFGIDAILLSDFAKIKSNEEIVELGTGTGIISILIAAKNNVKKIWALEIQLESAKMAERSVELNNLQDKIKIVNESLENIQNVLSPQSVNVVISNPPFLKNSAAVKNSSREIAIARHEIKCTLESVLQSASYVLKPYGRFYLIHKPERLSEIIIFGAKNNLEVKRLRFVVPQEGMQATMVLVEFVKCGARGMIVEKNLVVYKEKGVYSEEVKRIYGR